MPCAPDWLRILRPGAHRTDGIDRPAKPVSPFNSAMDIPAQGLCRIPENVLRRDDAPLWVVAGIVIAVFFGTHASDWQEIKNDAKGQTVWLTPGAAIPQLTAISTGLAAR